MPCELHHPFLGALLGWPRRYRLLSNGLQASAVSLLGGFGHVGSPKAAATWAEVRKAAPGCAQHLLPAQDLREGQMQVGGQMQLAGFGRQGAESPCGVGGWVITPVKIPEHLAVVSWLYMRVSFVLVWFCSIPNR